MMQVLSGGCRGGGLLPGLPILHLLPTTTTTLPTHATPLPAPSSALPPSLPPIASLPPPFSPASPPPAPRAPSTPPRQYRLLLLLQWCQRQLMWQWQQL